MNSNIDAYVRHVASANTAALEQGEIALSHSLPGIICRELEVASTPFADNSDPLFVSFPQVPRFAASRQVPRKIEFDSAVYLKEGVVDRAFPNSRVAIFFIGDGISDKRFTYNTHRLLQIYGDRYRVFGFIGNPDLIGSTFGAETVMPGWDHEDASRRLFYHAASWQELSVISELVSNLTGHGWKCIIVVDVDGTYFCPRPHVSHVIKDARRQAVLTLAESLFDEQTFSLVDPTSIRRMSDSYTAASATHFSQSYDDEDLAVLIALGLYAEIIRADDPFLNSGQQVGFTLPLEWLQFATFSIANNARWEQLYSRLQAQFAECAEAAKDGAPSVFAKFRAQEHKILKDWAAAGRIGLNRAITGFLTAAAGMGAVPVAITDRPNLSLGLNSTGDALHLAAPAADALVHTRLPLVD